MSLLFKIKVIDLRNQRSILSLSAVDRPLRLLKDCGPAALSIELTSLGPEGGGAKELLLAFIRMIDSMLARGRDFDLAHAYLALFLKVGQSERILQPCGLLL